MELDYTVYDAIYVVAAATVFTLLDRKFEGFRMKGLYRESIWQDFLVNLVVVAVFYTLAGLLFN